MPPHNPWGLPGDSLGPECPPLSPVMVPGPTRLLSPYSHAGTAPGLWQSPAALQGAGSREHPQLHPSRQSWNKQGGQVAAWGSFPQWAPLGSPTAPTALATGCKGMRPLLGQGLWSWAMWPWAKLLPWATKTFPRMISTLLPVPWVKILLPRGGRTRGTRGTPPSLPYSTPSSHRLSGAETGRTHPPERHQQSQRPLLAQPCSPQI